MADGSGCEILTDAAWAVWEPLIEEVRPRGKTPPKELRRTISAIFWRHQNGAKWRSIPAELGPWWLAAQLFIRWAKQGVWERLLDLVQQHDIALGMTFLDGTNIRAHHKAAGAKKGGSTANSAMCARRLADLAAAMAQKPAGSPTGAGGPSPSRSPPGRRMSCLLPGDCSTVCRMCRDGLLVTGALPPMPFASASGTWARDPPSHPSAPTRPSLARSGSTPTAISSRTSGRG